jgi:hypothetical protein
MRAAWRGALLGDWLARGSLTSSLWLNRMRKQ